MQPKHKKEGSGDDAKTNPQQKPAKNKSRFRSEFTSRLNYFCVEHWLTSSLYILALGFIAFSIQSCMATVTAGQWGVYGIIIVAAYIVLVGLHLILRRGSGKSATVISAISKSSPGRSFEVLHDGVGNWRRGDIFTEYEFRRLHPAPAPHPGEDPTAALNDYYAELIDRLLNLPSPAIRVVEV